MRLKSYFAGTVESAIRLARQEMGEDAMLVNSRKAPQEARHLGAYEVVFATAPDSRVDPPRPSRAEEIAPPAPQSLIQEMAEMRRQGLAKFLIAQVLRYLQDQFFSLIEIQTRADNTAAVNLLCSLGFEQVDAGHIYRKGG